MSIANLSASKERPSELRDEVKGKKRHRKRKVVKNILKM
jgi:hypothetical protein